MWGGKSTDAVESDAKQCLASALLEQIKISCYTEYKAFEPFTNLQYYLGTYLRQINGVRRLNKCLKLFIRLSLY